MCDNSLDPPYWYDCPTPSPVPVTLSPSRSPIPHTKRRLVVEIELDDRPTETGWTLSTMSNKVEEVLYEIPIGSFVASDAHKVLQYPVLIDTVDSWYNLTIYDSAGNGFAGTLSVSLDDGDDESEESRLLMKDPGFAEMSGNAVSHAMYVGVSPLHFLTLNLFFDDIAAGEAAEVSYELRNDDYDTIFALAWYERFNLSSGPISVKIPILGPVDGDRGYTLRMWKGAVSYQLYLGDPDDGTLLNDGAGTDESFHFLIEGTSPPTLTPLKFTILATPLSSASLSNRPSAVARPTSIVNSGIDEQPTKDDKQTAVKDINDIIAAATAETSSTPKCDVLHGRHIVMAVALSCLTSIALQ